ncbi:MAG: MBL fold metallo-hydrolase [Bryobacterales bacterium]
MPADAVENMKQEARGVADGMQRFYADEPVDAGDTFDYEGGRLEVLRAPGHSLELLCFLDRANRTLYSTDAILEKITPNIGVQPFSSANPLGQYFDTLATLEQLDVDRIVPSHGSPLAGIENGSPRRGSTTASVATNWRLSSKSGRSMDSRSPAHIGARTVRRRNCVSPWPRRWRISSSWRAAAGWRRRRLTAWCAGRQSKDLRYASKTPRRGRRSSLR